MDDFNVIKDAKKGEKLKLDCIVCSVKTATAVNGNSYNKLTMRDREGTKFSLTCFENPNIPEMEEGTIVTAEVVKVEKCGDVFTNLISATVNKTLSYGDFIAKPCVDINTCFSNIINLVKEIDNDRLNYAVRKTIADAVNEFKTQPLTATKEYARTAGILESTSKLLSMVCNIPLSDLGYNRNIMIAGAALYYIGAVDAVLISGIEYEETLSDKAITRAVAAHDKFRDTIRQMIANGKPVPDDETVKIIDNILLSPLKGISEITPEAFALARLSDIILAKERYDQASEAATGIVKDSKYHEWFVQTPDPENSTAQETATA